jgi:hypothetical protein
MSELEAKLLINPLGEILRRVQELLKSKAPNPNEVSSIAKDFNNTMQFIINSKESDEMTEILRSDPTTDMTIDKIKRGIAELYTKTMMPNGESNPDPLRNLLKMTQKLYKTGAASPEEIDSLTRLATALKALKEQGIDGEMAEIFGSDLITGITADEYLKALSEILATIVTPNQEAEELTSIFN